MVNDNTTIFIGNNFIFQSNNIENVELVLFGLIAGNQQDEVNTLKENGIAFAVMVFFLELIILIGVAFDAYYTWTSYDEMKTVMNTPKYKQLELNTVSNERLVTNNSSVKPNERATEITSNKTNENVAFKVQIASGRSKIETKSYNFKGLNNVERVKIGSGYKYYIGNTSNYDEIEKLQQVAKSKGYKSAFIVAFENGNKVPLEQVFKKS